MTNDTKVGIASQITDELEVVWPLNRWHYLTVSDPDVPADPPPLASTWAAQSRPQPVSGSVAPAPFDIGVSNSNGHNQAGPGEQSSTFVLDPTQPPGRALAVHAFLQGGATCRDRRVSALLGVSARTIGRDRAQPLLTTPPNLERAQALIAASADRGSTPEEREAAAAWLQDAARDAHQVAVKTMAAPPAASPSRSRKARGHARRPPRHGAHRNGSAIATAVIPNPPEPLMQVDALRRQQQRILHRSALIDYVLASEKRTGEPLRMGDALAELLTDITEAARTIGTLLQRQ